MAVRWTRLASPIRLVVALFVAAVAMGAACRKDLALNMDAKFSVNLVRPAVTWPRLDRLTPAELEVYDKYGKPDYFRLWYNPHGEISTSREAGPAIRRKLLGELPRSWVYEEKKIEVQFRSPAKFEEVPFSDRMTVLCLRGDPDDRDVQTKENIILESWTYYDVGEKYVFVGDRQVEKQVFKGVGRPFCL